MLTLESIPGGPFAGLPAFVLRMYEGDETRWEDIEASVVAFFPPVSRLVLAAEDKVPTAFPLAIIAAAHRFGLAVTAECYTEVPQWAVPCDQVVLFTDDVKTRQCAHLIVFRTEKPPTAFRATSAQLARNPLVYWWPIAKVTSVDVAALPTGMRLWSTDFSWRMGVNA